MKKKRTFGILGILLVVLILAGGGMAIKQRSAQQAEAADSTAADSLIADSDGEKDENPPVPVALTTAGSKDLPATFRATGSLAANRLIDLVSKSSGQVTRVAVDEGHYVKAGQILAELDPDEERLLLDKAEVTVKTTKKELERLEQLSANDLTSEKELEAARERADLAVFERDLAKVRLDHKIIRAPFSGQVTNRYLELGQTVNMGAPLFGLADVSPMEVFLFLPEEVVRDISLGQEVLIRPDVNPDPPLPGKVHQISPIVDPATSTVKVTLRVSDVGSRARVGSFVRASITTDVHTDVVAIPKKAVVPEAGASFVFVAEADTARKVAVTTGYSDDEYVEVLTGIDIGDTVITVGQGGLRNGSKIRTIPNEDDDVAMDESKE